MKKVTRLFVAKDVSVATTGITVSATSPADGVIVAINAADNAQYEAANDNPTDSPAIFLMQGDTTTVDPNDGVTKLGHVTGQTFKWSDVVGYKAQAFQPARPNIWYVGAAPSATTTLAAGTGSIVNTSSAEYELVIMQVNDADVESATVRYNYTSSTSATQSEIALAFETLIQNDIANLNSAASKLISACNAVGDGTGVDGLTSPTDYGIQIKFKSGVKGYVGARLGFGSTVVTEDTTYYPGMGTYTQMQAIENESLANRGHKNTLWFAFSPTKYVVTQPNSAVTSTSASGTIVFTAGSKAVTTGTGNVSGTWVAGDAILVGGTDTYTIKSVTLSGSDTDSLVLDEPFRGSTVTYTASSSAFAASAVTHVEGYDLVVLDVISYMESTRAGSTLESLPKCFVLAFPSYVANASTSTTVLGELNDGLTNFPAITL